MYSGYKDKNRRKEYMRQYRLNNRERLYVYFRAYYHKRFKERETTGKPMWTSYGHHQSKSTFFQNASLTSKRSFQLNSRAVLEVIERDGAKCKQCGATTNLTIHHLNEKGRNFFNQGKKPDNRPENMVIWCRSCHGRHHSRQYWSSRK